MRESGWSAHLKRVWYTPTFVAMSPATTISHFLPCKKKTDKFLAGQGLTRTGFAQIQMVVPIAATAWELSQQTGDSELLEKVYAGSVVGMHGCGVIVTPARPDFAKGSVVGTPDTITARAGKACPTIVRTAMRASVLPFPPCRGCVPISRLRFMEDASRSLPWQGRWERIRSRPLAGGCGCYPLFDSEQTLSPLMMPHFMTWMRRTTLSACEATLSAECWAST